MLLIWMNTLCYETQVCAGFKERYDLLSVVSVSEKEDNVQQL